MPSIFDMRLLVERDGSVGLATDVHVEKVGHVPFVLGFPAGEEGTAELGEGGVGGVVRVDEHDVVDVVPQREAGRLAIFSF